MTMCGIIQKRFCHALWIVVALGVSAHAVDITYTGNPSDPNFEPIQTIRIYYRTTNTIESSTYKCFAPSDLLCSGNKVTINFLSGEAPEHVFGGWSQDGAEVANNTVIVLNGTVKTSVRGGFSDGSTDDSHIANHNTVIIDGGRVEGNIYGGFAQHATVNALSGNVANNNSVILRGGTIYGGPPSSSLNIYGGYASPISRANESKNNSITVYEAVHFTRNISLRGNAANGPWIHDGNILNVYGKIFQNGGIYSGTFASVSNFQFYNFYLTDTVAAGDVMLPVTAPVALDKTDGAVNTQGQTTIGIIGVGANSTLNINDRVVLIDHASGTPSNLADEITAFQGLSRICTFQLDRTGSELGATLLGIKDNDTIDALPDVHSPAVGLVRQGGDLLVNQGMESAWNTASCGRAAFLAGHFGNLRHRSSSGYADLHSGSLIAGMVFGKPTAGNCLKYGLFFETGRGEYDAISNFIDPFSIIPGENIHGNGRSHYIGGGVLLRCQKQRGAYYDASFRTGQLFSDYATEHLVNHPMSFDYSAWYCGSHLGLGHIFRRTLGDLDLSANYLWTYLDGGSQEILGDHIRFYGCHSHRLRAGGQFLFEKNRPIRPFLGAAYEYELAADLRSSVNGMELAPSHLHGGTGIGELGLRMQFRRSLAIGLAGQGYVGQRSGASASCDLRWDF